MISGYRLRERLQETMGGLQKELRFAVRRRYLRQDIKKFHTGGTKLTAEEMRQARAYWSKYTKHFTPMWHAFFKEKYGKFDVRFVPEDLMFTDIEGALNDWSSAHGLDNKNNYELYFPMIKHPTSVVHKMHGNWRNDDYHPISEEEAISICLAEEDLIFKYALESGKGGGIRFWRRSDGDAKLRELFASFVDDIACQRFLEGQHKDLAAFNESSINSVRIVTLALKDDIVVLCAYLRMGIGSVRVDNVCAGGCCSGIIPDGHLQPYAYDKRGNKWSEHPVSKIKFDGFLVPSYDKIKDVAIAMHHRIGNFRIISWDIAVDPEGDPVFIEMNLKYGAMEYHQMINGPLFGDRTEEILNEVYGVKS